MERVNLGSGASWVKTGTGCWCVYIVSEYQMNVSVSPSVLEKKKKKKMFGKVLIVNAFNERKQAGWSTC